MAAEIRNDASTINEAKTPENDFGRTPFPRLITRKPMSGKTGISQANCVIRTQNCGAKVALKWN